MTHAVMIASGDIGDVNVESGNPRTLEK